MKGLISIKKLLKITAAAIFTVLILLISAFFLYTSIYYKADDTVVTALNKDIKSGLAKEGQHSIIIPARTETDTALIFYPGAKVEAEAYYPLLSQIAQQGITCILVKMPFHLAVLDSSAADGIIQDMPEINNWYIGGHSMGGAMASSYMASHPDSISGLILLGAYPSGEIDKKKALVLYSTRDGILSREKLEGAKNVIPIEGGNHAGFGNYGKQKGDGDAFIQEDDQQEIAVNAILKFIQEKEQEKSE